MQIMQTEATLYIRDMQVVVGHLFSLCLLISAHEVPAVLCTSEMIGYACSILASRNRSLVVLMTRSYPAAGCVIVYALISCCRDILVCLTIKVRMVDDPRAMIMARFHILYT